MTQPVDVRVRASPWNIEQISNITTPEITLMLASYLLTFPGMVAALLSAEIVRGEWDYPKWKRALVDENAHGGDFALGPAKELTGTSSMQCSDVYAPRKAIVSSSGEFVWGSVCQAEDQV